MKTKLVRNILIVIAVLLIGWWLLLPSKSHHEAGIRRVDAVEFREVIKNDAVKVIDVRSSEEHQQGFIPGTDFNFDVKSQSFKQKVIEALPQGATVAIYCRSGNRSQKAAALLAEQGFQVIELSTGFKGWKELEEK